MKNKILILIAVGTIYSNEMLLPDCLRTTAQVKVFVVNNYTNKNKYNNIAKIYVNCRKGKRLIDGLNIYKKLTTLGWNRDGDNSLLDSSEKFVPSYIIEYSYYSCDDKGINIDTFYVNKKFTKAKGKVFSYNLNPDFKNIIIKNISNSDKKYFIK